MMKSNTRYSLLAQMLIYNATYYNYQYNVVFGNHLHIMSSHVRPERLQLILAATGKC